MLLMLKVAIFNLPASREDHSGLTQLYRTSSFAFRGKEQDIRKIAERLNVRTILEGSVRRAGTASALRLS